MFVDSVAYLAYMRTSPRVGQYPCEQSPLFLHFSRTDDGCAKDAGVGEGKSGYMQKCFFKDIFRI